MSKSENTPKIIMWGIILVFVIFGGFWGTKKWLSKKETTKKQTVNTNAKETSINTPKVNPEKMVKCPVCGSQFYPEDAEYTHHLPNGTILYFDRESCYREFLRNPNAYIPSVRVRVKVIEKPTPEEEMTPQETPIEELPTPETVPDYTPTPEESTPEEPQMEETPVPQEAHTEMQTPEENTQNDKDKPLPVEEIPLNDDNGSQMNGTSDDFLPPGAIPPKRGN